MAKRTAKPKTSRKTKTTKSKKHIAGVKWEDVLVEPGRKSTAKPNAR